MAISRARKALLVVLTSALAVTATTLGMAHAETGTTVTAAATTDDMPSAVESLDYPNAELVSKPGATLKRGSGGIVLTSCDGKQDILVMSRWQGQDTCFEVKTKPAYLTLEFAEAFGIITTDDPVKTTLKTAGGSTLVVNAPANKFTGYGEASSSGEPATLLELRVAS
ncbi:hypothetical protein [Streptomyces sp. NPDC058326]|uniref:hypothetical protein n=1 Tax=Streptomyces sp. NPDC058326 TaxID=3346447 RepID=UPI0036E51DE4